MSREHSPALLLALLLVPSSGLPGGDSEDEIAVLLLSGMNNHDWRRTTPALEEALEKTERFEVTVLEKTETMTAELLAGFDVVVSNFNTFVRRRAPEKESGWSEETKKALIDFVRRGKGHVTVHAGSSSFYDWPEYQQMVLGSFKVGQTSHGRQHEFPVTITSGKHPITSGLSDFRIYDELWHGTDFQKGVTVLATAYSSRESGGSGRDEPVAVAGGFGEGRSFFLVLGHGARGIASDGFRTLLARGTEWAATGAVRESPSASIESAVPFEWQRKATSLALMQGSRTVWRFQYDPAFGKAHFHPLGPVGGPSVTWVMPPDHVWHYGLWFSWKYLNRINYWEEDTRTHRGQGLTTAIEVKCTPHADHSATIEMALDYHLPAATPDDAVLTEKRTIDVSAPRADGSYLIDWRSRFTAGSDCVELDRTPLPREKGGKAYGGYAGLSLRMRNMAERQAVSPDGPVQFNSRDRFRGKATAFDYSGVLDGKAVGVAICDHPENLNAPTPWYAIRSPVMTFFMPAVICFKSHTLKAHESFALRYRIAVHNGRWDEKRLGAAYDAFVEGRTRS